MARLKRKIFFRENKYKKSLKGKRTRSLTPSKLKALIKLVKQIKSKQLSPEKKLLQESSFDEGTKHETVTTETVSQESGKSFNNSSTEDEVKQSTHNLTEKGPLNFLKTVLYEDDIKLPWESPVKTDIKLWNFFRDDDSGSAQLFEKSDQFEYTLDEIKFFPANNSAIIVVMQLYSSLGFRGKCAVEVLKGCISILGFKLTPKLGKFSVSSPATNCAISIIACPEVSEKCVVVDSMCILSNYNFDKKTILEVESLIQLNENAVVLALHEDDTPFERFLTKYYPNLYKPKEIEKKLPVDAAKNIQDFTCIPTMQKTVLRIPNHWLNIEEKLKQDFFDNENPIRVIVCGGKNFGKSTLLRYLMNSFLNECGSICLLDGDPGQSECTPCGCVSLLDIHQPFLGPPFTNHLKPFTSYFIGGTDVGSCPDHYLACIKELISNFETLTQNTLKPLFINTMGWTTGLGVEILVDLIVITQPTHILQLTRGNSEVFNFPRLTPQYLREKRGWLSSPKSDLLLDYSLMDIVAVKSPRERKFLAPVLRTLGMLAYFGKMQNQLLNYLKPVHGYNPYKIPWSNFGIYIYNEKIPFHQIMYCLNGSLVGLGICNPSLFVQSTDESLPKFLNDLPVCPCVGYAIIRGINMEEKTFYLITPVEEDVLEKVNILLKGNLQLPHEFLLNQKVESQVPYVANVIEKSVGRKSVKGRTYRTKLIGNIFGKM